MTTMRTLITASLRRLGANSANAVPTAEDTDICLQAMNALLDSLSNSLLNIHTITPHRFMLTPSQATYTLGPEFDSQGNPTGADWVVARPMRIEQAVILAYPSVVGPNIETTGSTMFYPLALMDYRQYSSLTVRNIETSWPTMMYDNGAYPIRELAFWPVPQSTVAVELWLWEPLATYATLDDELNLPPGYERYLILKLAMEIAPEFGKSISDTLRATLTEAENVIKTLNQPQTRMMASNAAYQVGGRRPAWVSGTPAPYSTTAV